ncbi:MAG: hypothetical protein JO233_03485 [Candidatus Eremiobacteraeota bacterium]|nr:hypothetical protein [Candidatus Eremiobacteraeota bacterium]
MGVEPEYEAEEDTNDVHFVDPQESAVQEKLHPTSVHLHPGVVVEPPRISEENSHEKPPATKRGNGAHMGSVAVGQSALQRVAVAQGYCGDPCNECGQFTLVRNGTCLKCDSCGATSGCS